MNHLPINVMKNLVLLLLLLSLLISCKNDNNGSELTGEKSYTEDPLNSLGVDSAQLISGSYVFFLDEEKFPPVITETFNYQNMEIDQGVVDQKIQSILDFFEDKVKYMVSKEDVFVESFSAIQIEGLTRAEAEAILAVNEVESGQQNFTFQNIRARMQGEGPVEQNVRARMQEWQYDSSTHTSTNINFVNPNSVETESTSKIWMVDSGISNHQDLNVINDPNLAKSYVQFDPNPLLDLIGHGTHCAGIAAGRAHNESNSNMLGMNGVSPGAQLIPIKVLDWNGEGKWTSILKAMRHILKKASSGDIVNLSIGSYLPELANNRQCRPESIKKYRGILKQIRNLANKGVYVVMASGNVHDDSELFFPGCFDYNDHVITVASMGISYDFESGTYSVPVYSDFSTFGSPSIDFVAPGEMMFSTFPEDSYAVLTGTSMATALVSGIIHVNGGLPNGSQTMTGPPSNTTYPIAKVN